VVLSQFHSPGHFDVERGLSHLELTSLISGWQKGSELYSRSLKLCIILLYSAIATVMQMVVPTSAFDILYMGHIRYSSTTDHVTRLACCL
jgi:hypothetical protein